MVTSERDDTARVRQVIADVKRFDKQGWAKRAELATARYFLSIGYGVEGAPDALRTLAASTPTWLAKWDLIKAERLEARRGRRMTTDHTATEPITPTERTAMRANVGDNAARAEAARQARITAWKETMAPLRARLVASQATLAALAEAHRAEIAAALDTVRELTEERLDYKSVGTLRSFRTVNPLGVFDHHPKALQTLIDRIDNVTDVEAQNPTVATGITTKADLACGGVAALPAQIAAFRRDYRSLMGATWKPAPVTTGPAREQRVEPQRSAVSSTARANGAA